MTRSFGAWLAPKLAVALVAWFAYHVLGEQVTREVIRLATAIE